MKTAMKQIVIKLASGSNIFWVYTRGDETRAEGVLQEIAKQMGIEFFTWDCINLESWHMAKGRQCNNPLEALQEMASIDAVSEEGLFVSRDLATILNAPANYGLRRFIITASREYLFNASDPKRFHPLFILSSHEHPHPELRGHVDQIELGLPDYSCMDEVVQDAANAVKHTFENGTTDADMDKMFSAAFDQTTVVEDGESPNKNCDGEFRERLVRNLLGLTFPEAQRILAFSLTSTRGFHSRMLSIIDAEKERVFAATPGLTYVPYSKIESVDNVGGFKRYLDWLSQRALAYTRHAQSVSLPKPRGCILVGPAGTGKTMVAKVSAKLLSLDLLLLNLPSLFAKYVGESEQNMSNVLATVDAMPNTLLLVDEIDKGMQSAHKNVGDSGVSSRLLSILLTWLSERDVSAATDNRVFVIMTANRVDGLPPELLRAGRFDKIWSVGLPGPDEREEILRVHLRKQGIEMGSEISTLVTLSNKFMGAEIAQVVVDACLEKYSIVRRDWKQTDGTLPTREDVMPTIDDLCAIIKTRRPLSVLASDEFEKMKTWCENEAESVSAPPPKYKPATKRIVTRVPNRDS